MAKKAESITLTTTEGTVSFPHLSKSQAESNKNDKGEPVYDLQLIIPKSDKEGVKQILRAIKKIGMEQWGDKWTKVRSPLRDGDKEAEDLTEDGSTKGEKYPERLGAYFLNIRSKRPVGVYDRTRTPIENIEGEVYGGCKAKVSLTLFTYSTSGNHGIGAALNGVQKTGEGEPFGGGAPSVDSMFDMLDDDDEDADLDVDLDDEDEEEVEEPPARKRTAKKAPAKKAKAKAKPVEIDDDEDDLDDFDEDDLDDSEV